MEILYPITETLYTDYVNSIAGQLGDKINKRVGGGRVQMGLMTFVELANSLVPYESGFDKQGKKKWATKQEALLRVFKEYGLPTFEKAVVVALIRRWMADPKDGFIPLACGSLDIEAGLNIEADLHKEAVIFGVPGNTDQKFAEAIRKKVGITTEYGNGDSIEFVVPLYVAGVWQMAKDTEFRRKMGILIVSSITDLYCEGMNINGLQPVPEKLLSVKAVEAWKVSKQLCRECNII